MDDPPRPDPARIRAELRSRADALISVEGLVDRDAAQRVDQLVADLQAAGTRWVVLDLTGAEESDPALGAAIERASRRARADGGCLVVDGLHGDPGPSLVEIFRMYRAASGPAEGRLTEQEPSAAR